MATAGDVNDDGYADIIVGAPFMDHGQDNEGLAWLYLGSASGLSTTPARYLESNHAGSRLGYSVATAGDVNADGYSDVLVGAPYWEDDVTNEGRAWLYLGTARGLEAGALVACREQHARGAAWFRRGDGRRRER